MVLIAAFDKTLYVQRAAHTKRLDQPDSHKKCHNRILIACMCLIA